MQRNEHATATKHENKIYGSDVHKMVDKTLALRFKQAWLKRKSKTGFRLGEINTSLKFQTTKPSSEQQNNMIHDLIMTKKNMAWSYSTSLTKDPK